MASDVHIKNTTNINMLFNLYSNGLNIFYEESKEYAPEISNNKYRLSIPFYQIDHNHNLHSSKIVHQNKS